jgi:hypothetical protein
MQGAGTVVKYVNLAVPPPADLGVHSFEVKGCTDAFDARPRPPEVCYPYPVAVAIIAYRAGAGYTNASLVVRVTNSSKGPVVLPVGTTPAPQRGEGSYLNLSVNVENRTSFIGFGSAYGDAGTPSTLATFRPGESVEYEIPVEIDKLKKAIPPAPNAAFLAVVKLSSSRLERRANGDLVSVTDTNPIPSVPFAIPCPK